MLNIELNYCCLWFADTQNFASQSSLEGSGTTLWEIPGLFTLHINILHALKFFFQA